MSNIFKDTQYASDIFKALSNKNRLVILSSLVSEEMNVGEMEARLNIRQPTLSQQLARLRTAQLVKTRRVSKEIYYSLANAKTRLMIESLLLGSGRTLNQRWILTTVGSQMPRTMLFLFLGLRRREGRLIIEFQID